MANLRRNAAQWMTPLPSKASAHTSHVASPRAVPDAMVEERVRGGTTARDAVQQAAEERQSPRAAGSGAQHVIPVNLDAAPSGQDLGYPRNMHELYRIEREIGRGANGVVTAVTQLETNKSFACKSIPKRPSADLDEKKQAAHVAAIQREIAAMRALRSCLNVARLEGVFEDDESVHIVQELCTGGELVHSLGQRHYSERTVASYMRAVLKTVAQCHAHGLLHRDVKPGNFMLADSDESARIKAIDFGLAVPYNGDGDIDAIDMQGTPWFLAPETLSSKWSPKADTWAAGVMCYQLLTGRLPFNDKRNPHNPQLTAVLRSILTDKLNFDKSYWQDISAEAKDFVQSLLNRDEGARPTAAEALAHPWLAGDVRDRKKGRPLSLNVVQRIQRFGRSDMLKRSLLELMAVELAEEDRSPEPAVCKLDEKGRPVMDSPHACAMELVLRYLKLDDHAAVSRDTLADGLQRMGYRLQEGELDRLCNSIGGNSTCLSRAAVIASQIDWRYMQRFQKERWLSLARRAFDTLDTDNSGTVSVDGMIDALQNKIPADEVQQLYQEVASTMPVVARARNISFQSFMQMLRLPSNDSLDIYDDRHDGSISTLKSQAFGSRSPFGGGLLSATPTAHGHSILGAYLPSPSPSHHSGSQHGGPGAFVASAHVGTSPGEGSGKGRGLAASCAASARLEGSGHRRSMDHSGHHGHDLSTVFEQTSI